MYPSLVLSAALVTPAAPVPRDAAPNAAGPAPHVLALKPDSGGAVRVVGTTLIKQTVTGTQVVTEGNNQVQKQVEYDTVTTHYLNKTLADLGGTFGTADGKPLTANEATARVKAGAAVLASADGKPVGKAWLRAVAPDTVVLAADGLAHTQFQWGTDPLPSTPAPRLAMLSAGEKGAVLAPVTSHPATAGTFGEEIIWEGRGRVQVIRGRGAMQLAGDNVFYLNGPAGDAKVLSKPLAEVTFDAYDRSGKRVPRADALKRLSAGGLVLVAGDNRVPDEAYLKALRDDVLVLVGGELVLPVQPLDKTKKKQQEQKPAGLFRE